MRKIIKKIVYLLGWLLFLTFLFGIIASVLINTPNVQEYITTKAFGKLDDKFGNHFTHNGVRIRMFNRVDVSDLLITDQQNDTLIYAPKFRANFPALIRKIIFNKELPVRIGALNFENSYFRFYSDSLKNDNLRFIFDTLKALKDTNKLPKPLFFNRINIKNSQFALLKYDTASREDGIDFSRMVFNDLNIKVRDFKAFKDTIAMNIKRLDFTENSGLRMESFTSDLHICNTHMYFDNPEFEFQKSRLDLEKVHFDFTHFKDFGEGKIFEKVRLTVNIKSSVLYMDELGYFIPFFREMPHPIQIQGSYYGKLADFNGRNIKLSTGNKTFLKGKFDLTGLPDVASTFLFFDIDEFETNIEDINNFILPGGKRINLPDVLSNIESINYHGNFTGFFRDFVSYGQVSSELGTVMTDVLFEPDSNNMVTFVGSLQSEQFNIGALTDSPDKIGNISLNLEIDGAGLIDGGFDVDLKGDIAEFEVNKYNYRNILVDGNFSQNRFNGMLEIDDENAKVQFDGLVDLSSDIRQYIFNANVYYANLYNLNFHKKDPDYTGSFLINADIAGNSLDEINGRVKLLNSLFTKSDAQIQVYDLQLDITNDSTLNELALQSDFMDGKLSGHFKLTQLLDEYIEFVNTYLPAVSLGEPVEQKLSACDFTYSLEFKNSLPVFNFFIPDYSIYPRSVLEGSFIRDSITNVSLHFVSPELHYGKTTFKNLVLNSSTIDQKLFFDIGGSSLNLNNRIVLDNFTLESFIDSNNLAFESRWMNWDSLLYKGGVSGGIQFLNNPGEKLSTLFEVDSSMLIINDSIWKISPFAVHLDSANISVDSFHLSHTNETVFVDGSLTDNLSDSLFFKFSNFNFANLNAFTRNEKFMFEGILDGDVVVKGFKKPLIFAEMNIQDLALNNESIGNTYLETSWDNEREALVVNADVSRGKLNTLNVRGDIFPSQDSKVDLSMKFDKFRLNFINPYLDNIFDNINGLASGTVSFSGTTKQPKLNGSLNLQKAALTVDYLKTRYNFTSTLGIANNNLVFDNIHLHDIYGNTASLNGLIRTDYFKNYNLNLSIKADNFLFLNTQAYDNDAFYGTAFATGLVRINGEPSSLKIDVSARTEQGTDFNIPLSGSEELSDYDFIKYIDEDSLSVEKTLDNYDVNLTGMQLDFDLKVTPDARVKIIFDPTMGDIIEATGKGDMRIAINTLGDFKIIGEYIIERGDYLFTLKDVLISKKFKVEQGSSLRWSGDPLNADIDIDTYYRTKASLADLDNSFETVSSKTVDCQLSLTGKLMQPNVGYDINLPYSEQEIKDRVASRISTEEEKGKQFLSLLILNRFFYSGSGENQAGSLEGGNIAGVNASELLSNQLSNWLSQISNDFDIGVSYRPGTEISPQEVEVALSTQLLNDRLSINGSVDMKTNAEVAQANTIVGDVDIDYKITKNGKIRARVFNRANEEDIMINNSKYTQGVGMFYTEEFDSFDEVINRYKEGLKRKNKKKENNDDASQDEAIREEEEGATAD